MLRLNTQKYNKCNSPAFTLVELMVVLAVIGILVMILMPVLQKAREHARSTACQNNLRQYGIAMGRYMSDNKGYFIYPGEGGVPSLAAGLGTTTWKLSDGSDKDSGKFGGNVEASRGAIAGSQRGSWSSFIVEYLPKIRETNYAYLISSVSSVKMCPAVQQELRRGNYFDPRASNYFKGYREEDVNGDPCDFADFEQTAGTPSYDADDNFILDDDFTTYAINRYYGNKSASGIISGGPYYMDRKDVSDRTIAFIDWNAKEGWQAEITSTNWMFNTPAGRSPSYSQDTPKCAVSNIWWLTEVGFHHKDGTNAYANYVAMDGHVASVSSNEINLSYFEAAGPR